MKVPVTTTYEPRRVAVLDRVGNEDWQLKAYWMSPDGSEPDHQVVGDAAEAALAVLEAEDGYGAGFLIVHRGVIADWIVLGWWTDEDILRRRVLVHDGSGVVDRSDEHFLACVWELSVVDWERKAWINTVLRHPENADTERYLAALYPSEFC